MQKSEVKELYLHTIQSLCLYVTQYQASVGNDFSSLGQTF